MRSNLGTSLSPLELFTLGSLMLLFMVFTIVTFTSFEETQDAAMVQSIHVALQGTVTQSVINEHVSPTSLSPLNVVNAVKTDLPNTIRLKPTGMTALPYEMDFLKSGRKVFFTVSPAGDVQVKNLSGHWSRFTVINGVIQKN